MSSRAEEEFAIEVCNVSKLFGTGAAPFKALDDVSVNIRENEFFTLLGPSGCGKTTLLRLIAGFTYPTEGEIRLHGSNIAALPPFKRPVNTVFQNYALFPHMTVGENIAFGLQMLGRPKADIRESVDEMVKLVKLEAVKNRRTGQLSGGQQQRVALARALAPRPKVLLLDEPLSALDYKLRKEMQIELKRLQHETGVTFIFVTHDQEEALTMADRIAVMSAGRILQVGTPHEIYDRPADRFVAAFIGETNFLTADVAASTDGMAEVTLPGGARISAFVAEGGQPTGQVSIVVRPEHAEIVDREAVAHLTGQLDNIVYFGTDTHFHVSLDSGQRFIVRRQNSRITGAVLAEGDTVGITLDNGAAQILKD
ncbi:ABC transporter ATP-binding protein [uncultured Hoeflea sp.]|uniref:ABC transporter ATP-binding protein n=1 Tax=uncultured Hoeflea sp. TaxID=538666 RepID=UPI0030DB13CF